ncbi:MAG TPA: glycosyltransferase family 4 protein, partial [Candidatus Eisenbacteria bacterium]|nr:glycosyltransferase family 4 protein [Candidatus Eisenbacteria bacterium]
AFLHGRKVHSLPELTRLLADYVRDERRHYRWHVEHGLLSREDYSKFEHDVNTYMDLGMEAALGRPPRTRPAAWFDTGDRRFLPFPTIRPDGRRLHIVIFTREYPPGPVNGIGRLIHALAPRLADRGHVVRVMTTGSDHDTVDLEEGAWVHRVVARHHDPPPGLSVPPDVWNYCASLRDEAERMHAHRPVDVVHVPNWDAEGLAVILDGKLPVLLELHTPLATVSETNPMLFPAGSERVQQVMGIEGLCYRRAGSVLASSPAIVEEIEARYGIRMAREAVHFVPHGLPPAGDQVVPRRVEGDRCNLLFVGRLERRKGIDTLLQALVPVLHEVPDLVATIVGDSDIPGEGGTTYRAVFEAGPGRELGDRVRFVGRVDDAELTACYAGCDLLVVPSRYESFGLVLLEGMMLGKPVIAGDAGGMRYIVEEGGNGFRFPPGDAAALAAAIRRLATSPELRERFGRRSREIYEERYTAERMVDGTIAAYLAAIESSAAAAAGAG